MNVALTEDVGDVMIGARAVWWDHECTVTSGYDTFACCLYCERDVRTTYALMARCCTVVDLMSVGRNALHLNPTECPVYCTYCT